MRTKTALELLVRTTGIKFDQHSLRGSGVETYGQKGALVHHQYTRSDTNVMQRAITNISGTYRLVYFSLYQIVNILSPQQPFLIRTQFFCEELYVGKMVAIMLFHNMLRFVFCAVLIIWHEEGEAAFSSW
jgi:hypothetical protein